uniref:GMP phosphodiesterase delta subunit domain-containing protein n=1 Tax=Hanusia phi TaxID=3032 RepID=A0A7S0EEC1_9CRYP|mmetsp:Transcript_22734/g.51243  ORF Transcript_22734/g.51243 Transcript_22734/m.51243 type:complete len:134 (+) Transcript_22734:82-483(+)
MGERGEVYISSNPEDAKVVQGFKLEHMNMRDADSGQVLWESPPDWEGKFFLQELEAHVPREILACKAISREVRFSSVEKMDDFKLLQKVYFQGSCFEEVSRDCWAWKSSHNSSSGFSSSALSCPIPPTAGRAR